MKYSVDDVRKYLESHGCTLISDKYTSCKDKIEYACVCGYIANRTFDKIKNRGVCCRNCQKKKLSENKKLKYDFVKDFFEEKGCVLLSKKYVGNDSLLEYICSCGQKSKITFAAFKDQGQRCKCCGEKKRAKSYSKAGGVVALNICIYDTHNKRISYAEETRRSPENQDILEVKCAYCGEWFKPTLNQMWHRAMSLEGRANGENRFYCSESCKTLCPVFGTIKYPKGFNPNKQRPGQSEFRERVLERDNYTCQICGHHDPCGEFLVAHHVDPVVCNPIESMDIDNGITLCQDCHKHAHSLPGCSLQELSKISI